MNTVLSELLGEASFVYIDDIVIYSHDLSSNLQTATASICMSPVSWPHSRPK